MGWFAKIAWSLGMWICGACVMSWFGSQIRIANNCTRKLLAELSHYEDISDYMDVAACKKYLNVLCIITFLIITVISLVIWFFVPTIGIIFYCIGMFVTWVTSLGSVGISPNNVQDSLQIFFRFLIHERDNVAEDLSLLVEKALFDLSYKASIHKAAKK